MSILYCIMFKILLLITDIVKQINKNFFLNIHLQNYTADTWIYWTKYYVNVDVFSEHFVVRTYAVPTKVDWVLFRKK